MTTTTNYGYNVITGSDTPVNIQNDIAPNFTAIDSDLKDVSDAAITVATHTVAGSVHQLVRDDADRNVIYFVATGDMVAGDTFTVDGVTVTARLVNGETLATGSFKINNNVFGILVGTVLNLFVPGATATASGTTYDNTGSGLTATNVQDAIDELISDIPTGFPASAISYNNTVSGLTASDVQYAIDEIVSMIPGSSEVQVITDGTKSNAQLLDQLYSLVNISSLTAGSTLEVSEPNNNVTIYKYYGKKADGTLKFGATWYDGGSVLQWATVKASGSTIYYSSSFGSPVNASTPTPAISTVFKIKY